jgi:hypothetical protein
MSYSTIDLLLNREKLEYKSDLGAPDFKQKLDSIFSPDSFEVNYNLSGEFTGEFAFTATDKWTLGFYIRSFERDPAYLKGLIEEDGNGSVIYITVRPNYTFQLAAPGALLICLTEMTSSSSVFQGIDRIIAGLVMLLAGIVLYALGVFFRIRLRNKFEKYLGLNAGNGEQEAGSRVPRA